MWKSKVGLISTLLQFVLVCAYEMNSMFLWNEWNYTGMKPECAMSNQSLDLWSRAGLSFMLKVQPGPLSSPHSSEDSQNETFRVTMFDSIFLLTFSRKKTKRMISWSLRKPNYQFRPSGTALMLSCCSLMAIWLWVTSLWVTNVETDLGTHACIRFFCAAEKPLQHHRRYFKRSHFSTQQFITTDSSLEESRTDEV